MTFASAESVLTTWSIHAWGCLYRPPPLRVGPLLSFTLLLVGRLQARRRSHLWLGPHQGRHRCIELPCRTAYPWDQAGNGKGAIKPVQPLHSDRVEPDASLHATLDLARDRYEVHHHTRGPSGILSDRLQVGDDCVGGTRVFDASPPHGGDLVLQRQVLHAPVPP